MAISLKDLFVLSIQQMMGMWSACHLWDSRENSKNLPAVEKPVYDLVREGKDGFYYHIPKDLNISYNANVSALLTLQNDPPSYTRETRWSSYYSPWY